MVKNLLTAIVVLTLSSAVVVAQSDDVFSDAAVAKETAALRSLTSADKQKVLRALELLKEAHSIASASSDVEEVAKVSQFADAAVDAATDVIPNGVLKGALVACKKAIGHSFILRLLNARLLDPTDVLTSRTLEEIILRYQLAGIPAYERPAKVLDFANAHILVAYRVGQLANVVSVAASPSGSIPKASNTKKPHFADYPAGRIYTGRNARPRLDSSDARLFRTRLREAAQSERPNFAGRIILTQWGCGAYCVQFAMIDAPTGRVYFSGFSVQWSHGIEKPLEFRSDSRLLIVRGMRNEDGHEGVYYYTFRNGRLSPVR